MGIDVDKIRVIFAGYVADWVQMMPEKARTEPFFGIADSKGQELTPVQILEEVQKGTDFGNSYLEHMIGLAAADALPEATTDQIQGG